MIGVYIKKIQKVIRIKVMKIKSIKWKYIYLVLNLVAKI